MNSQDNKRQKRTAAVKNAWYIPVQSNNKAIEGEHKNDFVIPSNKVPFQFKQTERVSIYFISEKQTS